MDVFGGSPQVLADARSGRGGSWNAADGIIFAPHTSAGLFRVAAQGGTPAAVTTLASGEASHRWPQFLPDGKHFLFSSVNGVSETRGVYVGSIDGTAPRRLLSSETTPIFVAPDWLLTATGGKLLARHFDPARQTLGTVSMSVADDVGADPALFRGAVSASAEHVLIYRRGGQPLRQLTWLNRDGAVTGTVGPPDDMSLAGPELSPNGERVAVMRTVGGGNDIWVYDLNRGVPSKQTFEPGRSIFPVWSSDGSRLMYGADRRGGKSDIYQRNANGAGGEQPVIETPEYKVMNDISRDGQFGLFTRMSATTGSDVYGFSPTGNQPPFPVVQTSADEAAAQFSPDSRWIAYESNESGSVEVYVQPFRHPGDKLQVSSSGGTQPRWRPDGRELYFVSLDNHLMATTVERSPDDRLRFGPPAPLFTVNLPSGGNIFSSGGQQRAQYAVARDGRFLVNTSLNVTQPIQVVLNWPAALKP